MLLLISKQIHERKQDFHYRLHIHIFSVEVFLSFGWVSKIILLVIFKQLLRTVHQSHPWQKVRNPPPPPQKNKNRKRGLLTLKARTPKKNWQNATNLPSIINPYDTHQEINSPLMAFTIMNQQA